MAANVVDRSDVEAVSWKSKWIIDNLNLCPRQPGFLRQSPIFKASTVSSNTIEWSLIVYPKGKAKGSDKDYILLRLHANELVKAISITYKILDNKDEVVETLSSTLPRVFDMHGNKTRYKEFVLLNSTVDPISAHYLLRDVKMTIICEINTISYEVNYGVNSIKMPSCFISVERQNEDVLRMEEFEEYLRLINNNKYCDIWLVSNGQVVMAHKCILAMNSLVFSAILDAEMNEKQESIMELLDIRSYDVLVEIIRFVYSGKVVSNMDTQLADGIAAAAEKYVLGGMKYACEKSMCKNLNIDNATECLRLAGRYRMDKLKKEAIRHIIANANVVIRKEEFKLLPYYVRSKVYAAL